MLTSILSSLPLTKFVLIEDSIKFQGVKFLKHLLQIHQNKSPIQVYLFHSIDKQHTSDCVFHDYTSALCGSLSSSETFENSVNSLNDNCIIVIDSLVHLLYRYGLSTTYEILLNIRNKSNIQQLITILHKDLLENDRLTLYFESLATLFMNLDNGKVDYTFKKSIRKVITNVELYRFENDSLITESLPKQSLNAIEQSNPEDLTTFKIGLSLKDKESRDNLVLPYLPPNESSIHYTLDEIDDWDEEDPDDDLDL